MVEIQQYSDHQSLPVSGESFLNTKFYFITKCGFTQVCKHWEISPRHKVWRQTGMRANVELFIEQQGIERWSTE